MATHTQLPIYKAAYSLLDVVMDLVKNMPRDFKRLIGEEISKESVAITILVFRANVYLDELDQFIKHRIGARHYARYVDDFVLLHESVQWLTDAHAQIEAFLPERLHANLNPKKTILQPLSRGVDFVGQVIKPWHRTTRRKTVRTAMERTRQCDKADLFETANSYFGLLRQSSHSHHDRNELANLLRYRGHCIKADMTKTYRRSKQKCI